MNNISIIRRVLKVDWLSSWLSTWAHCLWFLINLWIRAELSHVLLWFYYESDSSKSFIFSGNILDTFENIPFCHRIFISILICSILKWSAMSLPLQYAVLCGALTTFWTNYILVRSVYLEYFFFMLILPHLLVWFPYMTGLFLKGQDGIRIHRLTKLFTRFPQGILHSHLHSHNCQTTLTYILSSTIATTFI